MSIEGLTSGIIYRFHKALHIFGRYNQPPMQCGVGAFLLPGFTIEWFTRPDELRF
jgi:hypothetical protein